MPAISSKQLRIGDIIFETKPLLICIKHEFKAIHCNNCVQKSDSLKKCGKCRQMYYCDKSCQLNDWKYHKNECKIYRKFDMSFVPFFTRYLLRIWLCVKTDPEFAERRHKLIDGSDVSLNEIQVKVDRVVSLVTNDIEEMICFNSICQLFTNYGIDFDLKELHHWYGFALMAVNQPIMYYEKNPLLLFESIHTPIGFGVCIEFSNISHSCVPNSGVTRNGLLLQLRAMDSITSGEEITATYTRFLCFNKVERHQELAHLLEECHCIRCDLNLDKDWDYDEWADIYAKNIEHWSKMDNILMSRLSSASYLIDNKLVKYLRLFYGEFNPHSNEMIVLCFICYAYHSLLSNPSTLTRWYEFLRKSMALTHGKDHPLYEMLSTVYYNCI